MMGGFAETADCVVLNKIWHCICRICLLVVAVEKEEGKIEGREGARLETGIDCMHVFKL